MLLYFIAFWAIVTGMTAVYLAIRLRKELTGEWLLALAGLLSAAFGVMLIARPGQGALTVVFLIACYAVTYGVLLIWLAFKLEGPPQQACSGVMLLEHVSIAAAGARGARTPWLSRCWPGAC